MFDILLLVLFLISGLICWCFTGDGPEDHPDPDGQWGRLPHSNIWQQGERLSLLWTEWQRRGQKQEQELRSWSKKGAEEQKQSVYTHVQEHFFKLHSRKCWSDTYYQVVKEIIKHLHAGQIQLVVNKQSGWVPNIA